MGTINHCPERLEVRHKLGEQGGGGAVGTGKPCQDRSSDTRPTRAGRQNGHICSPTENTHGRASLGKQKGICPLTCRVICTCPPAKQRAGAEAGRRRSLQPLKNAPGFQWGIGIGDSGKEEGSGQGRGGLVLQP